MHSPWLSISLADYEGHMSYPAVHQAKMLAEQFGKLLAEFSPPSVAVIGCAGGNGFDRICPAITGRVVGVDINPHYVQALSSRYCERISGLELHLLDIQEEPLAFRPVDLIYAALLFEYVELAKTIRNLKSVCRPNGILATVLQLSSESLGTVSPSPFKSLQVLSSALHLVPRAALDSRASEVGFALLSSRHVALPFGKEFAVKVFRLPARDGQVAT